MAVPQSSRLKPVRLDPLDRIGLVSKGDTSLLNPGVQESYFLTIHSRYEAYIAALPSERDSVDLLTAGISRLCLQDKDDSPAQSISARRFERDRNDQELSTILLSMRKLRESLVSTSRIDAFAVEVYVFIVRAAIFLSHPESYHPALLHLLGRLCLSNVLSVEEKKEFVAYHVLDLACRQRNLAGAYWTRSNYQLIDSDVDVILEAVVSQNWVMYWKARERMDRYKIKVTERADDLMTQRAIDCLGRSYLSVNQRYLEKSTHRSWHELRENNGVNWTLDKDTVIIKPMKRK